MNDPPSAEQQARDMMERAGWSDAQSCSSGDVVEIANLIADLIEARQTIAAQDGSLRYLRQEINERDAALKQPPSAP